MKKDFGEWLIFALAVLLVFACALEWSIPLRIAVGAVSVLIIVDVAVSACKLWRRCKAAGNEEKNENSEGNVNG